MVTEAVFTDDFERSVKKIRDSLLKERVKSQIRKIISHPDVGKPLRFQRKGERSVRIPPFRLIYAVEGSTIYFLDFGKRDEIY